MDPWILAAAIEGSTVTGAEPTNYPQTDGIIIYLLSRHGRQYTLEIRTDDISLEEHRPYEAR